MQSHEQLKTPEPPPQNLRRSRHTAVAVNIVKLLLLAALAPPVVAGIAQRAHLLVPEPAVPGLVAFTITVGSIGAIIGALMLPAVSDLGHEHWIRWGCVLAGIGVGATGLGFVIAGTDTLSLTGGWGVTQLGFSGAMAVLRTILSQTLVQHRRSGAVVAVLLSYLGLLLPLVILLFVPSALWHTTVSLVVLSIILPLVFLGRPRVDPPGTEALPDTVPGTQPGATAPGGTARQVPRILLLLIQCCANIVMSAFMSFHALDIEARLEGSADFPVRPSVGILIAAVLGLVATSVLLLRRPAMLGNPYGILIAGGVLLGGSCILRATSDSLMLVGLAAAVTGIAVGLNSSALLASALEAAPANQAGRFIGLFSGVGAAGQLVGPLFGLWVLNLFTAEHAVTDYRSLFYSLAVVPLLWAVALVILLQRPSAAREGVRG